jgi:hypothetical protein
MKTLAIIEPDSMLCIDLALQCRRKESSVLNVICGASNESAFDFTGVFDLKSCKGLPTYVLFPSSFEGVKSGMNISIRIPQAFELIHRVEVHLNYGPTDVQ